MTTSYDLYRDPQGSESITSPIAAANSLSVISKIKLVALAFDATGSMVPIWDEAKRNIGKLIVRLREIVPDAKLGLIAYRDYDHRDRMLEFFGPSDNTRNLTAFISSVQCIDGETDAEAVEVALQELLDLKPSMAILVGDSPPHGVTDEMVECRDYLKISRQLGDQNVPIYTVIASQNPATASSFQSISRLSGGKSFRLNQVDELIDLLSIATAKRAGELKKLTGILRKENGGQITARQEMLLLQAAKD